MEKSVAFQIQCQARKRAHEASSPTQELKELRRKVQLYESGGGDLLLPASRSMNPFSREICAHKMSKKIKIPVKRYNVTSDPFDQIEEFEAALDTYNATDADKCKGFPITLEGNADNWFRSLATSSIESFEDLRQVFLTKFWLKPEAILD